MMTDDSNVTLELADYHGSQKMVAYLDDVTQKNDKKSYQKAQVRFYGY
jgi:hypothetical protein